jgi:hypothetical protein
MECEEEINHLSGKELKMERMKERTKMKAGGTKKTNRE